ncbi:response regulator [Steroidobacter sp. S1-65]|uniref:histidine kinase n=1 Tax=Steroidobacter gossypii TaxID=2805490 RepID=A0ABS1WVD0_9GAMM|nr:ATP-binding protein [Steroidobacter gossypii]MBM0104928.1 response regulator [Steroidobacter gossypii]
MRSWPDLSIAQRLAIGFGLFFVIVATMLAVFFSWHASSARMQETYSQRVVPLRDRTVALERGIFNTGIALRSVLLDPQPARVKAFEEQVTSVRSRLDDLARSVMEADGRSAYLQIEAITGEYLLQARAIVRRRLTGPVDLEAEASIARLREQLFGVTGAFQDIQAGKATAALAEIAQVRERISKGLVAMALAAAFILTPLAVLTARAVSGPAQALVTTADAMKNGNWKPALDLAPLVGAAGRSRDEMRRLADAIGSAAVALERREQRLRADGALAGAVASTLEREELANRALQAISSYLGAIVGIVYWAKDSNTLVPFAHYATAEVGPFAIGEGIPGQAALERRPIYIDRIPARSEFQIKLGYDSAPPSVLAALPLVVGEALHGVLLVGALGELAEDAREFLAASATQLSIGLEKVRSVEAIQALLAEVRESNEKIQAQNEELQVQNEEIQAQSEEIQSQSEQLQLQHEEMQAQNEELIQQSDELRRHAAALVDADERKNRFLGVLAHELRNPMAPITNSLVILKQVPPGSSSAQKAQAIIERQAMHLVRLIDDLLDITRISEGKIHIQRELLDLIEVVRTCVEDLGAAFEQAGIALELDLPNSPVMVAGDRVRLCQVIGNLLNNCLKFCDTSGRVTISVRIDHAHGAAVVKVADNGIGMEADLLNRLFQPFSQGITGLARTNSGLGLGLALVRALVSLHEGTVEAHSDGPGRGAQFTVRLPLEASDSTLQDANAVAPDVPVALAAAHRILIIEDNVDAAVTLAEALRFDGHEVAVAHSAVAGIETATSFKPDVVLCDIGLPDMNGYDVASALRQSSETSAALLIAVTGYASETDKHLAKSAGFDVHVAKPLRVARLTEILMTEAGRRSAAGENR